MLQGFRQDTTKGTCNFQINIPPAQISFNRESVSNGSPKLNPDLNGDRRGPYEFPNFVIPLNWST